MGRWKFGNENHFHLLVYWKYENSEDLIGWRLHVLCFSHCLSYSHLWSFSILGSMLFTTFFSVSPAVTGLGFCCSVNNGIDHMKGTKFVIALLALGYTICTCINVTAHLKMIWYDFHPLWKDKIIYDLSLVVALLALGLYNLYWHMLILIWKWFGLMRNISHLLSSSKKR